MLGGDISTSIGATGGLAESEAGVTTHQDASHRCDPLQASGEVCPQFGEAVDGRPLASSCFEADELDLVRLPSSAMFYMICEAY